MDEETPDDTLFTLEELHAPCPENFTFLGVNFVCTEETAWHNDEYVPISHDVHDENYDDNWSYDPGPKHDGPTWGEVLYDIARYPTYEDLEIPTEQWRLIVEARRDLLRAQLAEKLNEVSAFNDWIAEMEKELTLLGVTGNAHTDALLKAFAQE